MYQVVNNGEKSLNKWWLTEQDLEYFPWHFQINTLANVGGGDYVFVCIEHARVTSEVERVQETLELITGCCECWVLNLGLQEVWQVVFTAKGLLFPSAFWFQNFDEPSIQLRWFSQPCPLHTHSFKSPHLCSHYSASAHSMREYSEKFLVWARHGGTHLQSQHLEIRGRRTATRSTWDIQWDSVSHKIKYTKIIPCRVTPAFLRVSWQCSEEGCGEGARWEGSICSPTGRSISGSCCPWLRAPPACLSFSCTTGYLPLSIKKARAELGKQNNNK